MVKIKANTQEVVPDSLDAYWDLDESISGDGGTVDDETGNGNNGTTNGGINTGVAGVGNTNAFEFDGTGGEYIDTGITKNYNTDSFSISAWIKTNSSSQGGQRIVADDTNGNGYALSLSDPGDGALRFFKRGTSTISLDTPTGLIQDNTWYHVVGVYNASSGERLIYIDNTVEASLSSDSDGNTDSGTVKIGGVPNSNGKWFNGVIDEVRIYTKALSSTEVSELYNNPAGAKGVKTKINKNLSPVRYSTKTWYDSNWSYRKKITITSDQVNGDKTDFVVPIDIITDSDLSANAQSSGEDILFTKADKETKIPHELERFDSGTGDLRAHVNIPLLSGSSDTDIYMYYGNSSAGSQEDVANTWGSEYVGVFHMADDPANGTLTDSSLSGNDGSTNGTWSSGARVEIQSGWGWQFDGADNRYVTFPDMVGGLDSVTIAQWYQNPSYDDGRGFNSDGTGTGQVLLWPDNSGSLDFIIDGTRISGTNETQATGLVTHIGTWDGLNMTNYRNGVEDGIATHDPSINTGTNNYFGAEESGGTSFNDKVFEIRISNVERSSEYVDTIDTLMRESSDAIVLGSQESF